MQTHLLLKATIFVALSQLSFAQADSFKRVNSVEFVGNNRLDDNTLKNQLQKVRVDERVTSSIIEWDIESNLKAFLKEHGFVQCTVAFEEVPVAPYDINIRIKVSEGSQYRLSSLKFTGMRWLNANAIAAGFELQPGDLVNSKKLKSGLDRLKRLYETQGYIAWSYIPEQSFDEQNKMMALSFHIDEGIQHHIAYIACAGCADQAKGELLKAQAILKPGKPFDPLLLELDTLRLRQMFGVIRNSVDIVDASKGLVGIVFWVAGTDKTGR